MLGLQKRGNPRVHHQLSSSFSFFFLFAEFLLLETLEHLSTPRIAVRVVTCDEQTQHKEMGKQF
jgi:hypothetical protein